MANKAKGPQTRAGLEVVTRNLPPPDTSGPRTERGKRIASLNSLRHGLRTPGLLRCKKDRCFFIERCELLHVEGGQSLLDGTNVGDVCLVELGDYLWFKQRLDEELRKAGVQDEGLSHLYAMTEVLIERCHKAFGVEPDLVRQVPVKGSCYTRPAESLWVSHLRRLWAKKHDLLEQVIAYINDPQTPPPTQNLEGPPTTMPFGHNLDRERPGTM